VPLVPLAALLVLFSETRAARAGCAPGLIVSPADGTVTDVAEVHEGEFVHAPAIRIGIFLSIFNVREPGAGGGASSGCAIATAPTTTPESPSAPPRTSRTESASSVRNQPRTTECASS
jgi:hypothetical protein